jgi:hypothetical protein
MTTMDCCFLVSNATTQLTVGNFNIPGENGRFGEALRTLQGIHVDEFVAFNTNIVLLAIKEAVTKVGREERCC